jgi:outer membrane usher protein
MGWRTLALMTCALASASAAADTQRALVPLIVNDTDKGTLLALLSDDDVLLRVHDLEEAGLTGFAGRRETRDGDEFVSLASLRSEAKYVLDPQTVTLDLTVPPAWLAKTVVDMRPAHPPGIVYSHDTSGFVNYAFNTRGSAGSDAFIEGGLSVHGDLLYSSVSRATTGEVTRGLTSYTHDDPDKLRRWVVGDTFASAGGLGGALFLGGLSVSRNFGLDPYFVRTPTMAVSGAVTTPSTIDVYVNGSIVRRQQVPPGTFDITSLSLPAGSGTTQIVVRDAFGQEKTLTNPFYASAELLAKGISEYSVDFGLRRDRISTGDDGYGGPALVAWQRFGWTDRLTSGVRFEADQDVANVGESLATRFGFGEVEAEVAASRDRGRLGTAGSLVFRRLGRLVNYGVFVRAQSPAYANLSLRASQDRARLDANAFAGLSIGPRASLTAQYDLAQMRDAPRTERVTLSSTISVSRRVSLLLSGGSMALDGHTGGEAFVGLSCFVGRGTTASVTRQVQSGEGRTGIDVQKSLPLGTGLGYRVSAFDSEGQAGGSGTIQYQTSFGRYEARYDRLNDVSVAGLGVSGGLVAIGGTLAMTSPVGESYALIRVPGVSGVTGLSSNQPIGRTNGRGDIVVPNLMPYYGNRLGISDQDLPLDYQIESVEKTVAPPYRGGAVVTFPALKMRSVRGSVGFDVAGETVAPVYGELTLMVDHTRYSSPLGATGEFEIENLPAGSYTASVVSQSRTCTLTIDVPVADRPIVDVGMLRCAIAEHP